MIVSRIFYLTIIFGMIKFKKSEEEKEETCSSFIWNLNENLPFYFIYVNDNCGKFWENGDL